MRPLLRITAEGEDVTARVADRLIDLRISDAAGLKADTMSMTLDDRDGQLMVPPHQSLVKVALGMAGIPPIPLTPMGSYRVDEVELTGPERRMRIAGTAADMGGAIRAPKTRAWENVTMKDMVARIAADAGLQPVVDPDLAAILFAFEAQTAESDLNLLTRLARRNGAVAKPADGRLVVARRGATANAAGEPLTPLIVLPGMVQNWRWRAAGRGRYASAEASWTELGTAQVNKVVVGEGDPRQVLRHVHSDEASARRAAQAALDDAARGAETATLKFAGFRPDAFAGARLTFREARPELGGAWVVATATHTLNTNLTTEVTLERPAQEGT